jgi:hypothetical protein
MNKEITLKGKTYPVSFNMKTLIGFEDCMGTSIFGEKFATIKAKAALVVAAVKSAKKDAAIDFERVLDIDDVNELNELIQAFNVVIEMSSEFFHVPAIEKIEAEKHETKEKN